MKRIHLTAEEQNARFVKSFYGRARGVVYSGFDQIFFEPEGRVMYPSMPKDTGASPDTVLSLFGEEIAEMEYLACLSIKNSLSPGILGLITERYPEVGCWVLDMIRRQRRIRSDLLSEHTIPGASPWPEIQALLDRPDRYEAAILQAQLRTSAHRLLEEFE